VPENYYSIIPTEPEDRSPAQNSLPVTAEYESIFSPRAPRHDAAYAQHTTTCEAIEPSENADAAVPVNGDSLIPTEPEDLSATQNSTSGYQSIFGPPAHRNDAAYTQIQKPHDYENAEAAVPVNRDYLIPVQTGDRLSTAQTSSPVTST